MRTSRPLARISKGKTSSRPRSLTADPSFIAKLHLNESADWAHSGKNHLLSLFKRMALNVPAYRRFLSENNVRRDTIRTVEDLSSVPIITKKNYLHKNSFADLLWHGSTRLPHVLTSTSGSTGKPTYFARSHEVDEHSSFIHELIFRTSSLKKDKSTLVIVCFGMRGNGVSHHLC